VTLVIAVVGGAITGFIASRPIFGEVKFLFKDDEHWAHVDYKDDIENNVE
jgi:hypothetical protein